MWECIEAWAEPSILEPQEWNGEQSEGRARRVVSYGHYRSDNTVG